MAGELLHAVEDQIHEEDGTWTVVCACQLSFSRSGRGEALDAHAQHHTGLQGLEQARAALRKDES